MGKQALHTLLAECCDLQDQATQRWHETAASAPDTERINADAQTLRMLVLAQHLRNFMLWHIEDNARRTDVDDSVIADCKRKIDKLNQERNDCMEKIDACLLALVQNMLPASVQVSAVYNTESPGMAIDRLSILSLKIWHMTEECLRHDAGTEHVAFCTEKLEILQQQRNDLIMALQNLIDEYLDGRKKPKIWFQCKMYNDPELNPSLYSRERESLLP